MGRSPGSLPAPDRHGCLAGQRIGAQRSFRRRLIGAIPVVRTALSPGYLVTRTWSSPGLTMLDGRRLTLWCTRPSATTLSVTTTLPESSSGTTCRYDRARHTLDGHASYRLVDHSSPTVAVGLAAISYYSPVTVTGTLELALVPLPNWPSRLWPQHLAVPLISLAHV